jgi:hypothetical protein
MRNFYPKKVLTFLVAAFAAGSALAAPFKPGNIVVARVGDGSAALSGAAAAVFLDEYTPAGALVQSLPMPTSVSGNNRILTATGNATTELALTRSADGRYVVLTGYGTAPGAASVATSAATDVARVIGLVGADGSIDTSTSTGDAFNGVSIRAAATVDGTSFYSVGANSGVRYQALGSFASTQLNTTPINIRGINLAGGNVYVSTSTSPYVGLSQVGAGLPTATGQVATLLPGFPGTANSPNSFFLADLDMTVPGVDVAYIADDRAAAGIQKWSLVNNTWVLNGTITGSGVRGLQGSASGTSVAMVASSANGLSLYALSDNAGYNAAPSQATLPPALVTAASNTAFRGVVIAPVIPAPAITSFTPTTGGAGATVTITGTNLTGATAVSIGTLAIPSFTVVSATSLTLVLPTASGAITGPLTVTTPGGTATSATNFNFVLAAQASQALPELAVYPNPATDYLRVELPQGGLLTVALRDLLGRQVLAPVVLAARQPLRLPASLAPGVYLLEVQQGTTTAVRRIEKK